ncbi:hypothetical protein ENSA5_70030 [Enhygromyxa salina]|uniref:Wadjet protein JetD C-terminal domain-containing protein n=1 Tax=Enhygromyxa salina TaxID=215803 RepID=A0A2S9XAL0_9BACT|nr:DUF2220 family protein [Enhygromyxa salina]PRP89896.1 hypothetical protein ENSA5_70030 [Enhygromyxa salina]
MSPAQRLLAAIAARVGKRRHVSINEIWAAYREVIRGSTGQLDARPELAALLAELAEDGHLSLPRTRWEHTVEPPLPLFVRLPQRPKVRQNYPDPKTILWPPELEFALELQPSRQVEELLAIKQFLAAGGRTRRFVPIRERSLELFGDEKRLEALARGSLFRDGRCSFALLRCHPVSPPLVYQAGPASSRGVILVVENLHTYASFRTWNDQARAYAAVAYASGNEFAKTVGDLPRLCELVRARRVEYFGDVDDRGLIMPVLAQRTLRERGEGLRIEPATLWYERLFAIGRSGEGAVVELTGLVAEGVEWMPAQLREPVRTLLADGGRLAQEAVGTDVLSGYGVAGDGHLLERE